MARKKTKSKWNRVHYFQRKKSTERQVGHPVYVYGTRGNQRKYLVFTHTPENGDEIGYERLRHNIDPSEEGKRDTWVKKQFEVARYDSLREPDKTYRIHNEDRETIKKYRK